jgi:hypothetical protein
MEFTKRAIRSAQAGITAGVGAAFGVPVEVIQKIAACSRSARWGLRAMAGAEVVATGLFLCRPLITLGLLLAVTALNATAQSPIITPSSGQFGQTIVKIIQVLYGLIFLAGFVFLGRAVMSYFKKDGFAYDLGGAGICWGINIVAYLVYALSKGQTIEIDGSALGGN